MVAIVSPSRTTWIAASSGGTTSASPGRRSRVSDRLLLYAMVCGVTPYSAAMESNVSSGATTCTPRAGASGRTAVTTELRARNAGRIRIAGSGTTAEAVAGKASAPRRLRSAAATTVATGASAAMTMQAAVEVAVSQRRAMP